MRGAVRHRQPSQAIALAAVAMIALVGAVAFVIDLGFFLEGRRELQLSADQAAEAGVVFLPECSRASDGPDCATPNNASDMAVQFLRNNGPIARQLCGHPTVSADFTQAIGTGATPGSDVTPGTYQSTSQLTAGQYYTLTVTIRCQPGFSFGRILLGSATEPLSASATAVVAGSTSAPCAAPVDVIAYLPQDGGTPDNHYGYPVGSGNLPGYSWSNQVRPVQTFGLDPNLQQDKANYYATPPVRGDVLEICLPVSGSNCTSQGTWTNWLGGKVCVALSTRDVQTLSTQPGIDAGHVQAGLDLRGYDTQGQGARCKRDITQVIYTPDQTTDPNLLWRVKSTGINSLCLWQIAILDSCILVLPSPTCPVKNGNTVVPIRDFVTLFLQSWGTNGGGANSSFQGVVVQSITGASGSGTKSTRLIR